MVIDHGPDGDRGATRLEVAFVLALLLVVGSLAMAAGGTTVFGWARSAPDAVGPVDERGPSAGASAAAPVSVNVAAAATIGELDDGTDTCARILGIQSRGFDCTLPLYVDAMDKPGPVGKVKYYCADSSMYHLVGGQRSALHKKCVLTTAARAGH